MQFMLILYQKRGIMKFGIVFFFTALLSINATMADGRTDVGISAVDRLCSCVAEEGPFGFPLFNRSVDSLLLIVPLTPDLRKVILSKGPFAPICVRGYFPISKPSPNEYRQIFAFEVTSPSAEEIADLNCPNK
jgi:hypothetical protein